MGRTAKPTELKVLAGNPGKRAINKTEPKPTGLAEMPECMTTVGQVVWKRVVASMPPGFFKAADSYTLATYCEAAAMWSEATHYFRKGGAHVDKGSMGQPVISVWVKIQSDSARQMKELGTKLGLNPADRQAINAPEDEPNANPFLYQ